MINTVITPMDGVLIGVVMLMASFLVKVRAKRFAVRSQQAWQWWYQQQQQQQHHQAEIVRDGLLQEAFALRRHLETHGGNPQQSTASLEQFNHLYQTLENLSNQLSPPFVEDSLPLALQFLIKQRTADIPTLDVDGGADWFAESVESNRVVLSVVDTLLTLWPAAQSPLQVKLWRQGSVNHLQVTAGGGHQSPAPFKGDAIEFQHLTEIFHSLISGTLDIEPNDRALRCQLSWKTTVAQPSP